MSTEYKNSEDVPSDILCKRLKELSKAVTRGERGMREFYMSIPVQVDQDADFVIGEAARRIKALENTLKILEP